MNWWPRNGITPSSEAKPGRPPVSAEIKKLIVKMANENPSWGSTGLWPALSNLGHQISDTSVGNILKEHGIQPAPERSADELENIPQSALGYSGKH